MDLVTLVILLFVAGVLLGVAEVFIPSAGILLILSIAAFVGSIACAFKLSAFWGLVTVLAAPVVMLVVVVKAFNILPKTRFGRRMILSPPDESEGVSAGSAPQADTPASTGPTAEADGELIGREGIARTELRPSGSAQIGNRRYNVVSAGDFINPGTKVRVIEVSGNRVVVEAVDET